MTPETPSPGDNRNPLGDSRDREFRFHYLDFQVTSGNGI